MSSVIPPAALPPRPARGGLACLSPGVCRRGELLDEGHGDWDYAAFRELRLDAYLADSASFMADMAAELEAWQPPQ